MAVSRRNRDEIKQKFIKIRCTEAEKKRLNDKATLARMSVSELVRVSVENSKLIIKDDDVVRNLTFSINRIGNNLNQLCRWCNSCKSSADLEILIIHLKNIEAATNEVLARAL